MALELARLPDAVSRVAIWWGALGAPGTVLDDVLRAPLLIVQGARDPWTPPSVIDQTERALTQAGVSHEVVRYPDGYHAFGIPAVGDQSLIGLKYDAELEADAWRRTLRFLGDV